MTFFIKEGKMTDQSVFSLSMKKVVNFCMLVTAWLLGILAIIVAVFCISISSFFLAMSFFVIGLSTVPPISQRIPRIGLKKKGYAIVALVILSVFMDGHMQENAEKEKAAIVAQKAEEDHQARVAEFAPIRGETINQIKIFMSEEKFGQARDLAKKYSDVGDETIRAFYNVSIEKIAEKTRKEEYEKKLKQFKENRNQILADIKHATASNNFEQAVSIAEQYVGIPDKEFTQLYESAKEKLDKQIAEKQRIQALQSMDIEGEKINASIYCKNIVKASLKAPRTAKFPWGGR